MFSVRLVERPLPSTDRDVDGLIEWMVDSLCLVRKRGDMTADQGRAGPVHRLLRDYLFGQPDQAWDAQMLADELAQLPAALNHHLARLVETGLVGYTNEGKGWRKYYVRGGSLSNAVAYLQQHCRLLLQQRIRVLELEWKRSGDPLPVELPQDESAPFSLGLVEHRPVLEGGQEHILPGWMNDFGLLGERPGKELEPTSLSVRLFSTLLHRNLPLSLDEAAELHDGPKARVGRILDRFRASGMVERIPRTDRLNTALWTAMTTQHQRRGEDWMLKKGGFQRLLSQPQQGALLKALAKGTLSVEGVANELNGVEPPRANVAAQLVGGPTSNGVQNGRGDPRCGSSPSPGSPRSRPAEDGACGRSSRRGLCGRSMSVREGEG